MNIRGYPYRPHRSLPQALADFLEAQERPIERAVSLDIDVCAEGLSGWRAASMRRVARSCKTTPERMRRARAEYDDGYGFDVYLKLLDEDSWCVCYIDLFYRVGKNPSP